MRTSKTFYASFQCICAPLLDTEGLMYAGVAVATPATAYTVWVASLTVPAVTVSYTHKLIPIYKTIQSVLSDKHFLNVSLSISYSCLVRMKSVLSNTIKL